MIPTPALLALSLMATPLTAPASAVSDDCVNYGILVTIGSTCTHCENHGVVVVVGESCWSHGDVAACHGDECAFINVGSPAHSHRDPRWEASTPCGVTDEPACWVGRMACYYVGHHLDLMPHGQWSCETQPGALQENEGNNETQAP